jgi:flagellar hook-associated protein 1 FlgK
MSDLLRIASSGLLAYQRALGTVSHNVANAATPGYSRQRVDLSAQISGSGIGTRGNGVTVSGITRLSDVYANSRLVDDGAGLAQYSRLTDVSNRVDRLLSDADGGLSAVMDRFFVAVGDVAADPNSLAAREVLLGRADDLVTRAKSLQGSLDRLGGELDERMVASVDEANGLLRQLADLNQRVLQASPGGTADLLDRRDQLLEQLASKIGVRTAVQDGQQLNIYSADGHALLLGGTVSPLSLVANPSDPTTLQLAVGEGDGSVRIATPSGGDLGGLFQARDSVLRPARAELNSIVGSLATAVNDQLAAGVDLNGNPGAPLFTLGAGPQVISGLSLGGLTARDIAAAGPGQVGVVGSTDNSNANALAALAKTAITANGRSAGAAYTDLVARVGVQSQQATSGLEAFDRMQSQNRDARDAVAGVNLDEEAANLLRLQQAFQAAAQVIAAADSMFQTVLGAVRR